MYCPSFAVIDSKYPDAFNTIGDGVGVDEGVRGNFELGVGVDVGVGLTVGFGDGVAVTVGVGVRVGLGVAVVGSTVSRSARSVSMGT